MPINGSHWYERPMDSRAAPGGEFGLNEKEYKGGEFLPLYVPRDEMPQIAKADLADLIGFALGRGVKLEVRIMNPNELRGHQRIKMDRVHAIDPLDVESPILASSDACVLDGNHRWKHHQLTGTPVNTIQFALEFEAAIALLFEFPKTTRSTP